MKVTEVTIRTKGPGQYYRGLIKSGYSLGKHVYFMDCLAYSGGGRKISLLSVDRYQTPLKRQLIRKLERFARAQHYRINFREVTL